MIPPVIKTLDQAIRTEATILHHVNPQMFSELTRDGQGVYHCLIYPNSPVKRVKPHVVGDYLSELLNPLCTCAWDAGYEVGYFVARKDLADRAYYEWLAQNHPHAGLIPLIPHDSALISEVCAQYHMPSVFIDYQEQLGNAYSVEIDSRDGIRQVMRHLIGLGHQEIGFLTGIMTMHSAQERLQGYREGLAEGGIPYNPDLVEEGTWWSDIAQQLTTQLLDKFPRLTALVASSDIMAFGAIAAINDKGLRIPDEISVTGFDDIPMTANIKPGLTTVRQPFQELAKTAIDLIIQLLHGEQPPTRSTKVPVELVIRQSTGQNPYA